MVFLPPQSRPPRPEKLILITFCLILSPLCLTAFDDSLLSIESALLVGGDQLSYVTSRVSPSPAPNFSGAPPSRRHPVQERFCLGLPLPRRCLRGHQSCLRVKIFSLFRVQLRSFPTIHSFPPWADIRILVFKLQETDKILSWWRIWGATFISFSVAWIILLILSFAFWLHMWKVLIKRHFLRLV